MKRLFGLFILCAAPIVAVHADVDKLAGKCDECHGKDGNGTDLHVPNIAGASATYITDTLNAYKSGDRPGVKYTPEGGKETDMGAIAKDLSDDDITALAEHYAGKPYKSQAQQVDAALAAKGKDAFDSGCEKCHSEGGAVAEDDAGILAGQGKAYLEEQFKLFSDGSRPMTKKMKKKWEKASEEDLKAIIEFLAGNQ